MNGLIKFSQQDLSEVEYACVGYATAGQFDQQVVGYGTAIFVVGRHAVQWLSLPAPVLQHLTRCLHKVTLNICSTEKHIQIKNVKYA